MPLLGRTRPDANLVEKLTHCLRQVVEPFEVDDRVPGHLMPVDAKLKPKVFVKSWTRRADMRDVYAAIVERGERPPRPGEPYRWVPPGVTMGAVWIGWPGEPTDEALAFKVGEWLLILQGRQKANYHLASGPSFAGVPSVHFETSHNGFGSCTMALIYDPIGPASAEQESRLEENPGRTSRAAATRRPAPSDTRTTEKYQEAVMNAALEFAEKLGVRTRLRDKAKWFAEREVNALYLGALEAWMHRLSDEDVTWLLGEMCAYLGAGGVPEDKLDDETLMDKSTEEMEAILHSRSAEYGELLLIEPLSSSDALRRAFSVRLRAELGGALEVERAAADLFHTLPDLRSGDVAQRFLSVN